MTLPADVAIRRAVPADAQALTDLHLGCWDDAYTGLMDQSILDARRTAAAVADRVERWRQILGGPGTTWLAERDGSLIGFGGSGPGRNDDLELELELYALYVRAQWWGAGVGHALFQAAVGGHAAYLWVLDGNDRGIGFYERQDFVRDGAAVDEPEGRHVRMVRGSPVSR